jgi:hypothetical protein
MPDFQIPSICLSLSDGEQEEEEEEEEDGIELHAT